PERLGRRSGAPADFQVRTGLLKLLHASAGDENPELEPLQVRQITEVDEPRIGDLRTEEVQSGEAAHPAKALQLCIADGGIGQIQYFQVGNASDVRQARFADPCVCQVQSVQPGQAGQTLQVGVGEVARGQIERFEAGNLPQGGQVGITE